MSQTASALADILTFPARTAASNATSITSDATSALLTQLHRFTINEVDDWGRDDEFTNRIWALSKVRWQVSVGGADHLPTRAGALVVVNARRLALAPVFAALSIGGEIGRPVRFVGRSDIAPLGPIMQRLGGLLPIADEVEGALRAGEVIVLGAGHEASNRKAGTISHRLVGAAVAAKVGVYPAATASAPARRGARVEIAPRVRLTRRRRGPLRELEIADEVERRIDALLQEFGGVMTGTPLDWLPISGIGGL